MNGATKKLSINNTKTNKKTKRMIMVGQSIRFMNFLLDSIIYFAIILAFLLLFNGVINQEDVKWISILMYFLYYFIFEFFKGQTLGKMITRTKLVSLTENKNYSFIQIFGRTFMRFIPLDILSYIFFKRGLHDWISKTAIIKL